MDDKIQVYSKDRKLIAEFDSKTEGLAEEEKRNLMVLPTVHIETNGESTFSFQMLANCEKWQQISHPENIYVVNHREYQPLNDNSYTFTSENNVRIVNVTAPETWYLLERKYTQIYNCGIYAYAKAKFVRYTQDGAIFTIDAKDCANNGNYISQQNAWTQVKNWETKDSEGEYLSYAIIKTEEFKPTGWEDAPAAVFFTDFQVSGDTATVTIRARAEKVLQETFDYNSSNTFVIDSTPQPASVLSAYVTSTITTRGDGETIYTTSTKEVPYKYSNGTLTIDYTPQSNETVSGVICRYNYYELGEISEGATCTFAYGAEVVDEHTVLILPKADKKYKLTINGIEYEDSEVKDARGVVMPRGSGGYAMWAVLHDSGWALGICDVIAKDFDASVDYGCFNVETDMKDILYVIQYIQELYGGILDWDSENKVLNYRAENSEDYQAYDDGFNKFKGYEFRVGKNMTEQPEIIVDNSLITKAYLLGYSNLNVKKVNDGKTYITDFSYTDTVYEGYLEQSLIYDTNDEGGQKQLLYWGKRELAKQCKPRTTLNLSVTDIRTVQGYEHEVFDLNDIVRTYYNDKDTGEEVYVEKRIILREYNVFAPYDCTVEVGDKTQNLSEIFKLIYNKSVENAPPTNGSGQISSDDLVIRVPDYVGGFDVSGWGGGFGGGGGIGGTTLTDYIELIAQVTTENTDAISGLIISATETEAQNQLFSQYQKQTDTLFSQTYSGLITYTDEKVAALELVAQGHWESLEEKTDKIIVDTTAGFEAQATQNESFTRQFSEVNKSVTNLETGLTETTKSLSEFMTYADETYATTQQLSSMTYELQGEIRQSIASIQTYVNNEIARVDLTAYVGSYGSALQITSGGSRLTCISDSSGSQVFVSPGHILLAANYLSLTGYSSVSIGPNVSATNLSTGSLAVDGSSASWKSKSFLSGISVTYDTVLGKRVVTSVSSTRSSINYLG